MRVLVVNAGSTSAKLAVVDVDEGRLEDVAAVSITGIGSGPAAVVSSTSGPATEPGITDVPAAVAAGMGMLLGSPVDVVGHRIVHGGARSGPVRVDDELVAEVEALAPLAPLHQYSGLAGIVTARRLLGDTPQTASFDTAFFASLPEEAARLPVPQDLADRGVRRYGFHGLAYQSVLDQLGPEVGPRAILAHLGGGASMTALRDGRPQDTTMGMTPLGGLPMTTRSGDLDPGVVLFLLRAGLTPAEVEFALVHRSGLAGISGTSGDLRTLESTNDESARLAVRILDRRLLQQAGAYAALLGGLDTLAFSGGAGEHDARLRDALVSGLGALALRPAVHVVEAREHHVIAREAVSVVAA